MNKNIKDMPPVNSIIIKEGQILKEEIDVFFSQRINEYLLNIIIHY